MSHRKLPQVMASLIVTLLLIGCGAPVVTPTPVDIVVTATPQATPTLVPPTATPVQPTRTPLLSATITDSGGRAHRVWHLTAKYEALGSFIGRRPIPQEWAGLSFVFYDTDNATINDKRDIPFAAIRRLTFEGNTVRIDMHDGSLTLLSFALLETKDAQGNTTESLQIGGYEFLIPGVRWNYALTGFSGSTQPLETGYAVDFWISMRETQSIEFDGG